MLGGMAPEQADKKVPAKPEIRSKVEDELERLIEKL
jgi:hypothetical protein